MVKVPRNLAHYKNLKYVVKFFTLTAENYWKQSVLFEVSYFFGLS